MKNLITSKDLLLFIDKNNKLTLGGKSSDNKKLTSNQEKAKTEIKKLLGNKDKKEMKSSQTNKEMIKQRTLLVATAGNKKQKAGFIRGSTVPFDPVNPVIPSDKN